MSFGATSVFVAEPPAVYVFLLSAFHGETEVRAAIQHQEPQVASCARVPEAACPAAAWPGEVLLACAYWCWGPGAWWERSRGLSLVREQNNKSGQAHPDGSVACVALSPIKLIRMLPLCLG